MTRSPAEVAHRAPRQRARRWSRLAALLTVAALCAALLTSAAGVASASSAEATGTLPPKLSEFAHCPVDNPAVTLCLAASDTGIFTINSTRLKETSPIILSLGLIANPDGSYTAVLPDDGTPALSAPPIEVPGGLPDLPGASGALAVTATPQLVGTPVFNIDNLLTGEGPAITLPTDVLLTNHFLGPDCTVGTAADPVTLNLTDGTTSPPPPAKPITGAFGKLHVLYHGQAVKITGAKLVDNSYAVPGASGCGPFGLLDQFLDLERKLPSAAGTNSVRLRGSSGLAEASLIRKFLG